jgi:Zn-dependent M28 family amino/carboxypeptidase
MGTGAPSISLVPRVQRKRGYNITATAFDGRSDYQAFADNGIPCGGLFTGADETKTPRWEQQFGGEAGETLDPNYHSAEDTFANLNFDAYVPMEKALVASVAKYAASFDSLPGVSKLRKRMEGESFKARRESMVDERAVLKGKRVVWVM